MRNMGFVISHKNRERRRALLPKHLKKIQGVDHLYFETGYGQSVGYADEDYLEKGAHVVSREEALACECICDMKLGDQDYLDRVAPGKLLFGWAHAVQDTAFTTAALQGRHTVLAWEEIYENGRYIFDRNREIAGEAAVLQAFLYLGKMPYESTVAIYGSGHTAKGAMRILNGLGADARVILPKYKAIPSEMAEKMEYLGYIYVPLGWRRQYAGFFELIHNDTVYYFIDNEYYFGGEGIYGYAEGEAEKYAFFCKAVLMGLDLIKFTPDIIHANDWQTGMLPVLLREGELNRPEVKSVFTIHNLKYQGIYGIDLLKIF